MVDSVPVEKEKDVLLDHDYDGIKELDNNLPPWWKYGFYFTIVFAVVYMFYYHVSGAGNLQLAEYQNELDLAAQQKAERMKAQANYVTEDNVVALTAAGDISEGKQVFMKLCAACHRADGGGQVGPNLTDEFWLHGGGIKNVFKTITYGVPNKGMLSWQSQLSPKQIQQISSYILTLKGSNPPAPKEQQGDKWEEPNIAASDSGKKNIVETSMLSIHDSIK
jgi:cytochrome c oxidase cbb3-type subunit 3